MQKLLPVGSPHLRKVAPRRTSAELENHENELPSTLTMAAKLSPKQASPKPRVGLGERTNEDVDAAMATPASTQKTTRELRGPRNGGGGWRKRTLAPTLVHNV